MAAHADPAALEASLAALAGRVRRLRIVRGLSLLLLAFLVGGFFIGWLDAAFALSVAVRSVLESVWLLLVGVLAWRFVVQPAQYEVPLEDIARQLEANGSTNLVAALAREKHQPAFPIWPSVAFAAATVLLMFGATVWVFSTPGSGEQVRRVLLPWYRPATIAPFEIIAPSGDAVIRRGDPVTLTAYLKPRDPSLELPTTATVTIREGSEEASIPMLAGGSGAFHVTRPAVVQDFEYRIQAGPVIGEWHTVRIAEAVDLSDQSTVAITPPEYAALRIKPAIAAFGNLTALQHSSARYELRFTRPADSAVLEWRPQGRSPLDSPDSIPVSLAPDRLSGSATVPLQSNGDLRIVLVNESGLRKLRTERAVSVQVVNDSMPEFERISGLSVQPRVARPGDRLVFAFAAVDDLGIAEAELEIESGGTTKRVRILSVVAGSQRAEGTASFEIPADANDGEAFRFRLRVRDTRRVAAASLDAQEALFPPAGWFEVKVSRSASPLFQQHVLGQRDALRELLTASSREVTESREEAVAIRKETAGQFPIPLDHGLRIAGLRERIRKLRAALEGSAKELSLEPDLGSPAADLREIARRSLRDLDDDLQQAMADDSATRTSRLDSAAARLKDASDRLEAMQRRNDRLAQNRIDQWRIETLAGDQQTLVNRLNLEPKTELAKTQSELLGRLRSIIAESETLRTASNAAAARESERLAADAKALLASLREFDAASNRRQASLRQSRLDAFATVQSALVDRFRAGLAERETALRVAGLAAPRADEFQRVVDLLKRDRSVEVLTELERLAQSLDRLAGEFETWDSDRGDPKLAASQFARWQADLRTRFLAAIKRAPFPEWKEAERAALKEEQAALLAATEKLKLAPGGPAAQRDAVLVHLRLASKSLEGTGAQADRAMAMAGEAFQQLGEKLPTVADRLARTRADVEKLRTDQNAIIEAVEKILRPLDRQPPTPAAFQNLMVKFGDAQVRQMKLADKLAALDLPGHEARQTRTAKAAATAAGDLKDGLPYDSIASLGNARRELERLFAILDGKAPSDEFAAEAAAMQSEVVRLLMAAGERPTVKQLEPAVALQQEVFLRLEALTAPEAPGLLLEAREAVKLAIREGGPHERIVQRARDAAETLSLLADRMNDRETERDRIRRLASNRRQAECMARKLAGRPPNRDASTAAGQELANEITELLLTRVGGAGHVARKKALDLYLRLQTRPEPDRLPADQRQLAEALADLARVMGDVAVLTTRPPAPPSAPVKPERLYLPSRLQARSLRDLSRDLRQLRSDVAGLAAELARLSIPAADKTREDLERRLLAFGFASAQLSVLHSIASSIEFDDRMKHPPLAAAHDRASQIRFAERAGALADTLLLASQDRPPDDALGTALSAAAALVGQTKQALMESARHLAEAHPADAAASRADALRLLRLAVQKVDRPVTPSAKVEPDEALRPVEGLKRAERAMQRTVRELGQKGSPTTAEAAMREAETELRRAAEALRSKR